MSLRILALVLIIFAPATAAQQTRTTCYDSGATRICETFDAMGDPISKSRCYQSGKDWRCDTQSINGGTAPMPLPSGRSR